MVDYESLSKNAPQGKLKLVVDAENKGTDKHLGIIADTWDLDDLRNDLCPELGIPRWQVNDVIRENKDSIRTIRRELLLKWKKAQGNAATYENLMKACIEAGNGLCADLISKFWEGEEAEGGGDESKVPLRMKYLAKITWKEGGKEKTFELGKKISSKWRDIGIMLDIEGDMLDDWHTQCQGKGGLCWEKVMRAWLNGKGANEYPVTWDGVFKILKDLECSQIATGLKEAVDGWRPLP